MTKEKVFVYGTLKKAYGNHRIISAFNGQFIGNAQTVNKFPLVVRGIPFLYDVPGVGHHVQGEVWEVPTECVTGPMDQLEGHGRGFYERKTLLVKVGSQLMEVWAYFYCQSWSNDRRCFRSYEEGLSFMSKLSLRAQLLTS